MSPEANKPEIPTQTGSDKFVDGHHPTDRVRPFKHGDLPDVYDNLLDRGVPAPTDINPVTLETPVDKIDISNESFVETADTPQTPLETKQFNRRSLAALTAVGLSTAVIGGFGALKMFGSEEESVATPSNGATVSAGTNPGEGNQTSAPETAPPTVSNEVVASVEQYPTAAEAIVPLHAKIIEYMNYHGPIEKLTTSSLTPEQMAEHDAMLVAVFGEDLLNPGIATVATNLREGWLEAIGYMSLTQQSIEAGYDSELFQLGATISDVSTLSENQIQFTLDNFANFEENGIDENMAPEYAEAIEADLRVTATLEQVDSAWRITGWVTARI